MLDDFVNKLFTDIEKEATPVAEFVVAGKVKSQEHYQELCGFLRGLETARALTKDLADRYDNE